ncbi:hypothetical protein C8Q78DRAFT_599561 [Trametes maxima]|nr:hypothetical protein C8Q78DRAFT_599561 [Trametes maxima]
MMETAPLLQARKASSEDVRLLQYPSALEDVPAAVNTHKRAFVNSLLLKYIITADTSFLSRLRPWLVRFLAFVDYVHCRRMLTIDHGAAFLIYKKPEDKHTPHWLARFLTFLLNGLCPAELVKRRSECSDVMKATVQDAFGGAQHDMYEIYGLATAPKAQGRGYAKALVGAVTDMGDAEGRNVWVLTSDARPFYERLGFAVVNKTHVGVDNPAWKHGPVEVCVMRRSARAPPVLS